MISKQRKLLTNNEKVNTKIQLLYNLKPLLSNIKSIAIYSAASGEADLELVINYCLANNIHVYAPIAYTNSKIMRFSEVFDSSNHEIFYPEDYKLINEIKWYNIDLILLPLLAADRHGHRIGQGGGYYDATISEHKSGVHTTLCGVGYSWQFYENIPFDEWDIKLDYFVSENKLCTIVK